MLRGRSTASPIDQTLKAWREVTIFLQQFVENNFGRAALRRVVREPTYAEAMFCIPPDLAAPEQPCIFFTDRFDHFTKLLFLGIESDLVLMNILSFCIFDLWLSSPAIAAFLTLLLDSVLSYCRSVLGKVSNSS